MPMSRLAFLPLTVLSVLGILAPRPCAADAPAVDFNRDIRPILSNNCFECHGLDDQTRHAGLRLDTEDGALAELDSGARAVVPGSRAESELFLRITAEDEFTRMPPEGSGKSLTPDEIERIRRWIDAGAPWAEHWSFIPPVRPRPPAVENEASVRNPIDRFILARLEREGLAPAPEAGRTTLLRRVTFDLTGLPPAPHEVDAFLTDDSPGAYEKLVDRLLDSPRFGEHVARYWLDVVRYGDTHGLHLDNDRSHWLYREWVIRAFNANQPFDRFTIEQVAGDLLPEPTVEQKIASGFNRCNVTTSEGGSIDEEVLVRYAVDRTEAIGTVFLGLTVGCAVCHHHKFDPVTQEEFYQLYAFYNAAADPAMDGNVATTPPVLRVPSPEQTAQLESLDQQIASLRQEIGDELAKIDYVEPGPAEVPAAGEPREYVWIDDAPPSGANLQGDTPWEFVSGPDHPVYSGSKSTRRSARGLSQHFFTGASPGLTIGEDDTLFAHVWLDPADPPRQIMLQFNDGSWEHRAFWGEDVIPWGQSGTASRLPMGPLPPAGEWVRLEVKAADVGLNAGAVLNGWAFTQHDGTVYWDKAGIVTRTPQDGQSFDSQLAWEAFEKAQSESKVPQPVRDAVRVERDERNEEQQGLVRNYFLEHVYPETRPVFEPLHARVDDLTKERDAVDAAIPRTLVMADLPEPRETFVLIRGEYTQRGEKVEPGVPAVLPPLPEDAPRNRLGLAQWLVDPGHPLTARVTVNRFWQQFFGRGLVTTAEDFGAQGDLPSHPELLDWLAVDFMENGWNVKRLMKQIVMSGTYRQSSRVTPDLARRDPENVLLARGPRFRMDAEVVRDAALAASGLLVERLGGRSVKPYQPEGIWEAVGFVGSNTREYQRDDGDALYRRSLYTYWKRTAPPPSLMTFDAPSRETCTAQRGRTNTPLQALVLMNDVQFVEAARKLAERMMIEGGAAAGERIAWGFRVATARAPTEREAAVLKRIFDEQYDEYRADPEAAARLLSVGESPRDESLDAAGLAAWTMVANLLLNLDETITKE